MDVSSTFTAFPTVFHGVKVQAMRSLQPSAGRHIRHMLLNGRMTGINARVQKGQRSLLLRRSRSHALT
eukprot:355579-Amphidinium_carterae.1